MSLVGRVGRKRARARFALVILYGALAVGAVTTLYPFFLMFSTGLKGPTDQNDNKLVPAYFSKLDERKDGKPTDDSLLGKYLADKYAGDAAMIASTRIGAEAPSDAVERYETFLRSLPVDYWSAGFKTAAGQVSGRLTESYRRWLQERYRTIDDLNRAYIEENVAFQTVVPPAELLERPAWKQPKTRKYAEWRDFKGTLPAEFRIPIRETRLYQEYLRTEHQNQFDAVPPALKGSATKFEELRIPSPIGAARGWQTKGVPPRYASGAAEALYNRATGQSANLPIQAYEERHVAASAADLRKEFAGRNYGFVVNYMALNGRALWNTAIFCLLAVLTHLIVNPLAAYALSRYPIRASGKILIFLLATMAFPAEVALIPSFLLLKDLGLLNTFAALVLPTMASGYMIFLLKGFFDSLPQELFEAGQLDGAKESTMMAKIALPLSRPVLGYIALISFMGAYGAFIYAFLVVQDQRMWTIMVWIYQLQQTAPKAVIMAALTLAAIPTLLVFLLAQRTIMRGIVLPSER